MTMPTVHFRGAALLAAFVAAAAARGAAAAELSEFQNSFDGWAWQWDIHRPAPYITPGVVTLDPTRGYRDGHSLKFDMGNGAGDNGTLWIEKAFDVTPGRSTPVSVSFALFNTRYSDVNVFSVGTYVGEADPQVQRDHRWLGFTNRAAGWDPRFAYVTHVTSVSGRVWVAASVHVTWEGPRVYWLDHVRVSLDPVLPGDTNLDGEVNGTDFAVLAGNFGTLEWANWGWGDFNNDRRVDGSDFSLLAANFGRGTSPGEVTAADRASLEGFAAAHVPAGQVPEPGHAACLLAAAAVAFLTRCRQWWSCEQPREEASRLCGPHTQT